MICNHMTDAEVLEAFKHHIEMIKSNIWDITEDEFIIVAERFEKALATVYEAEQILSAEPKPVIRNAG